MLTIVQSACDVHVLGLKTSRAEAGGDGKCQWVTNKILFGNAVIKVLANRARYFGLQGVGMGPAMGLVSLQAKSH